MSVRKQTLQLCSYLTDLRCCIEFGLQSVFRTAVRRRESIRYCTDDEVISYIEKNNLYSFSGLSLSRHSFDCDSPKFVAQLLSAFWNTVFLF